MYTTFGCNYYIGDTSLLAAMYEVPDAQRLTITKDTDILFGVNWVS